MLLVDCTVALFPKRKIYARFSGRWPAVREGEGWGKRRDANYAPLSPNRTPHQSAELISRTRFWELSKLSGVCSEGSNYRDGRNGGIEDGNVGRKERESEEGQMVS